MAGAAILGDFTSLSAAEAGIGSTTLDVFEGSSIGTDCTAGVTGVEAGRNLSGIHFAMEYLWAQNQALAEGREESRLSARGKKVLVIGGGDTGSDCVGTAIRQGALQVRQIEIMPKPASERADDNPWPQLLVCQDGVWFIKGRVSPDSRSGFVQISTVPAGSPWAVQACVVLSLPGTSDRPSRKRTLRTSTSTG